MGTLQKFQDHAQLPLNNASDVLTAYGKMSSAGDRIGLIFEVAVSIR